MITKASIRAIKTAQRAAGIPDPLYRELLAEVGRRHGLVFASSKDLPQNLVGEALDAIRAGGQRRQGWQDAQIARVRRYQELAGLDGQELRVMLREVSGQMHEGSPKLDQHHFERLMVRLEMRVADRVAQGDASWPAGYQPCYWRRRCGDRSAMSSRQRHEIAARWDALRDLLPPEDRSEQYLLAVVRHATGARAESIWQLAAWQASNLIDALGDRIHYAMRRRASGE